MITAKQAHAASDERNHAIASTEINSITSKIEEAIGKGLYTVTINYEPSKFTEKLLKDRGYTVINNYHKNEHYYQISW